MNAQRRYRQFERPGYKIIFATGITDCSGITDCMASPVLVHIETSAFEPVIFKPEDSPNKIKLVFSEAYRKMIGRLNSGIAI